MTAVPTPLVFSKVLRPESGRTLDQSPRNTFSFQPTEESRLIGRRLRVARVNMNKTLDQVAEAVGRISSATLSRTELGQRMAPTEQLRMLANYYGTTVEKLTAPSDAPAPWEVPTARPQWQPKPDSTVLTPEQYTLRVYVPQLEARIKDLEEQLAMFRGEQ